MIHPLSTTPQTSAIRTALTVSILFLVTLGLIVVLGGSDPRALIDQDKYHHHAIAAFAADWPVADFSDYPSATTPGYHWMLAAFGSDKTLLRLIGSIFGIALIAAVGIGIGRRLPRENPGLRPGWLGGVMLCLPLALSMYVVSSALWLLPDNAAWLCVWLLLLLIFRDRPWQIGGLVAAGVLLLLLVWFRQIHLWMAGALWASAWIYGYGIGAIAERRRFAVFAMGLATLPAVVVVGGFMLLWGGASPPSMQSHVTGPNPSVAANVLSLLGIYSVFFVGWLMPGIRRMARCEGGWCRVRLCLFGGLVIGVLVGVIPQTSFVVPERMSGLWNMARMLPTLMDRSPLIIGLSTFGGLMAGVWFAVLWGCGEASSRRSAQLWSVVLGLFVLANTAAAHAWQRYYEPFLLMLLPLMVVTLMRRVSTHDEKPSPWRWAGPGILAILQVANLVRVMS